MPVAAVAVILLQITCAVHVVRTGRNTTWLWIIIMAPLIGCLIYFAAELLPEMLGSRGARNAARQAGRIVDPDRDFRALKDRLETADTVDNRRALADEYLRRGEPWEALELYEGVVAGVHEDDPALLFGLARARFAAGDCAGATGALDRLRAANPDYQSPDAHLLYARGLEGQGRAADARREYEAVSRYYPGAEARCRYATFLRKSGEAERAKAMFAEIVRGLDRAGRAYVRDQREWYDIAKRGIG